MLVSLSACLCVSECMFINGCNYVHVAIIQVCYFGRHVFMGYLNNEEKTKEAIDDEGWLHSGDIGRLDEDGFLWLTGRIKGDPYNPMYISEPG